MKNKILSALAILLLWSAPVSADIITLHETTADLGGAFGNDFKLTMYENWVNQGLMNTEVYGLAADIQTSLGITAGAEHFGTFTGAIITDNQNLKTVIQELETAIEGIEVGGLADLDDLPGDTVDDNLIDFLLLAPISYDDLTDLPTITDDQNAGEVAVADTGTNFVGETVEAVLAEIAGLLDDKLEAGAVVTVSEYVEAFLGADTVAEMLTALGIPGLSVNTGPVEIVGHSGGATEIVGAAGQTILPIGTVVNRDTAETLDKKTLTDGTLSTGTVVPVVLTIAASDEDTAITTGTAKRTFRAPYAFTLTGVRASCKTAPTGANIVIDVNETGTTSVLATKITIEATEKTSVSATTQPVVGDPGITDDTDMSIDFDTVGSTVAGSGVKVILYGTRVLP